MPRTATLIVNPYSSGMTSRRERAIVTMLREHLDLTVKRTQRPGHAPLLAAEALEANSDIIISCGGDGTANEVLNGMSLAAGEAENSPLFAILPAGGTNVFSRSLGKPNHPLRATRQIIEAIVEDRYITANLGLLDERIFLFSAGIGLDGEVVKRVEQRRSGRRPSDMYHLVQTVGIFASERFALNERCTVTIDDDESFESGMVMVANTRPLTYMGKLAFDLLPDCKLEGGLDVLAPQRVNAGLAIRNALQGLGMGKKRRMLVSDDSRRLIHDVDKVSITCAEPQPVQVDGEYVGDRTHIELSVMRDAVRIIN